jgi:hypothetical protein
MVALGTPMTQQEAIEFSKKTGEKFHYFTITYICPVCNREWTNREYKMGKCSIKQSRDRKQIVRSAYCGKHSNKKIKADRN